MVSTLITLFVKSEESMAFPTLCPLWFTEVKLLIYKIINQLPLQIRSSGLAL